MGFFTLGTRSHHAYTTVNVRGLDIDIVIEGALDFDVHQFELEDVYLAEGREKIEGMAAYRLPHRIEKLLTSGIYDEHFHEAAWGQA
jgi:hypothetical protein